MPTMSDQAMICTVQEAYEVLAFIRAYPSRALSCIEDPLDFQRATWLVTDLYSDDPAKPIYQAASLRELAKVLKGEAL